MSAAETLDELLGHPDRRRVLELLAEGPALGSELSRRMGRPRGRMSDLIGPLRRHRLVLRRTGVVPGHRAYCGIRYVLTDAGRAALEGGAR